MIIREIINTIKKGFGKDTVIYEDMAEQELHFPSFFIRVLSDSLREELARRYRYRVSIEVTYMDEKLSQSELEEIRLAIQLLLSNPEGLPRAEKINTKETDGFLVTDATYTLFLSKKEKDSLMARLEKIDGKRKGN